MILQHSQVYSLRIGQMMQREQFVIIQSSSLYHKVTTGSLGTYITNHLHRSVGITSFTKKEHICRATIEATCFQVCCSIKTGVQCLSGINANTISDESYIGGYAKRFVAAADLKCQTAYIFLDSGTTLKALAVDGGMSNSDVCMQVSFQYCQLLQSICAIQADIKKLQADIIGIDVDRPQMRETTALGAAIAAGFAVNVWQEFAELKEVNKKDRQVFTATTDEKTRKKLFDRWERAVEKSRGWILPEDSDHEDD